MSAGGLDCEASSAGDTSYVLKNECLQEKGKDPLQATIASTVATMWVMYGTVSVLTILKQYFQPIFMNTSFVYCFLCMECLPLT